MTKKHFISLADSIRNHNKDVKFYTDSHYFTDDQIKTIAEFCKSANPNFNRERWLSYIAGECGPNGGSVKK